MANNVSDLWVCAKLPLTAAANLAGKSLVDASGAAIANAANSVFGVNEADTKSGDTMSVKLPPSIVEVIATGTVTKGSKVEALLSASVYANIDGTSTATSSTGVQNLSSGYPIGKALTAGVVNDTVLVSLFLNDGKTA